jgi:hypothetical protein
MVLFMTADQCTRSPEYSAERTAWIGPWDHLQNHWNSLKHFKIRNEVLFISKPLFCLCLQGIVLGARAHTHTQTHVKSSFSPGAYNSLGEGVHPWASKPLPLWASVKDRIPVLCHGQVAHWVMENTKVTLSDVGQKVASFYASCPLER